MITLPSGNKALKGGTPLFLALIAAGLAGNYCKFSILNADFIFGSIFAMLALQHFGFIRGIIAAAIISSYTYLAWNHPYAVITMTTEAAVVGWFIGRRKTGMVAADALYWLFIGIPIGYLGFHGISHFPVSNTMFLMTKQAINGIANALVARLIFTGYLFRSNAALISFREVVSNMLAFFVLCPALILVSIGGKADLAETDRQIRAMLSQDSRRMTDSLVNWVEDRKRPIVILAGIAGTLSPAQMQTRFEQRLMSDSNFLRIGLIDKEGKAIAYSPPIDERGRSTIGKDFADRPYIPVLKQKRQPMLSEVIASRFGHPDPVAVMLAPVLSGGDYRGYVAGILNFKRLRAILEINAAGQSLFYALLDKSDNVIITNRADQRAMMPFSRGKGTLGSPEKGISRWIPALPSNTSTIELWGKSLYVAQSTIGELAEWKLILEQPVAPFQKKLYDNYTGKLFMLFIILLGSLALAEFISRRITQTTEQLGDITHDLPAKLISDAQIDWPPESAILEMDRLGRHFREMADSLRAKFVENRQINESLEQRVEERTEELRKSEEFLNSIVENIPAMIFMKDAADLRYVKFNKVGEELLGYSREGLVGKNVYDIFPQREADLLTKQDREALNTGRLIELPEEIVHIRHRGERVLHTKKIPIFDKQGIPQYVLGIAEDITERKHAEERLREKTEEIKNYFSTALDLFCIADADGYFRQLNNQWEETLGYSPKELANKRFTDFVHPDDMKLTLQFTKIASQGQVHNLVNRYRRKDGEYRWIEWRSLATDNKIFTSGRDITERKHAEMALAAERERLAVTLRSIGDGVITTDVRGHVTFLNRVAEELTGWSHAEAVGQPLPTVFQIVNETTRKRCENPVDLVLKNGDIVGLANHTILIRRDGKEMIIIDSGAPIRDRDSAIAGVVLVFRDNTEKEKADRALQNADKLQAVGMLAAGIAHDFNNLMSGLFGYLDIAQEQAERNDSDGASTTLSKARGVFDRAKHLTHELLTFSKGSLPVRKTISIVELVEEAVYFALSGSNITPLFSLEGSIWLCDIDEHQLSQVFDNIVLNARQAMPQGGKVEITIKNVAAADIPKSLSTNDYVCISIKDYGTGIMKEHLSQMFVPFFTTKQTGSGLGLATSYAIVKKHDGTIEVESELGKGSTFHIYLPASPFREATVCSIIKQEHTGAGSILIMDDEEFILDMLSLRLIEMGYDVAKAENGDRAVELAREAVNNGKPFLIAILDLTIPGGRGGKDIAQELLAIDPAIKLVASSGYSEDPVMTTPSAYGFQKGLVKPYRKDDVARLLESLRH